VCQKFLNSNVLQVFSFSMKGMGAPLHGDDGKAEFYIFLIKAALLASKS
jgi:hypothetical protein